MWKYRYIIALIILTIVLVFLGIFASIKKGVNIGIPGIIPTVTPVQSVRPQIHPLIHIQTTPGDGSKNVNVFSDVSVTFTTQLNASEQERITLVASPEIPNTPSFSSNGSSVVFQLQKPLLPNQLYHLTISYLHDFYSWSFTTQEEQTVSNQDYQNFILNLGDRAFSDEHKKIDIQYPWLSNLPLQSASYFVYFDLNTKQLFGILYPNKNSSTSIDVQVKNLEEEIYIKLQSLGINTSLYKINWKITPGS